MEPGTRLVISTHKKKDESRRKQASSINYAQLLLEESKAYLKGMDKPVFRVSNQGLFGGRQTMRLTVPSVVKQPSILERLDAIEDPLEKNRFFNENKAAIFQAYSQLEPDKDLVVETKVFLDQNPNVKQKDVALAIGVNAPSFCDFLAYRKGLSATSALKLSRLVNS